MAESKSTQKSWLERKRRQIASGFDRLFIYEFDLLEQHRVFVEAHFSSTLSKFERRFSEEVTISGDPNDSEDRAAHEDHLVDEYNRLAKDLPRLQWHAQFLVVYATFESMLNELCRIVQRRSNFTLGFKDVAGAGISRSANYLSKVAGVDYPFKSNDWNMALLLGEIRNNIAHRGGVVENDPSKKGSLCSRIASIPGIDLKIAVSGADDAEIVLSAAFLQRTISILRNVLIDVANYELYDR